MSDGTKKTIIPKFTETKIGSKIKNGCKLSVFQNETDYYLAQVEFLENIKSHQSKNIFHGEDLTLGDFNPFDPAFQINMWSGKGFNDSVFYYRDNSDDIIGVLQAINLF